MTSEYALLAAVTLGATAIAWAAAFYLKRVDRANALVGLRNGVLMAIAIGAGTAALAWLVLQGAPFREQAALSVGLLFGLGFLWLGLTVMPIGFIYRGGRDWARYGTWAAVVIVVISLGLGWTAFLAYQNEVAPPRATPPTSPAASP
jgi:hypothetical protein